MFSAAFAGAANTTVMNANTKAVTGAETRRSQEYFARFIAEVLIGCNGPGRGPAS